MIDPKQEDIGRGVVYTKHNARERTDGVVTSYNDRYVFVMYSHQSAFANGQATNREDLEWLHE